MAAVNVSEKNGEDNALGMMAGGVGGAESGAHAGKKIQESATSTKVWNVEVQYDNGRRGSFSFDRDPGLQRGDRVKNAGQSIMRI